MLNKVQIIGHLGRDPEVRYATNGDAVCNFAIATTEKWKGNDGQPKEETEWHRVTAWGRTAEVAGEYLRKGSLVYVEGKIKTRKYKDKDGAEKFSVEIKCEQLTMLSSRQEGQRIEGQQQAPAQRQAPAARVAAPARAPATAGSGFEDMTDDIPFRDPMANKVFAMCVC